MNRKLSEMLEKHGADFEDSIAYAFLQVEDLIDDLLRQVEIEIKSRMYSTSDTALSSDISKSIAVNKALNGCLEDISWLKRKYLSE